MDQELSNMATIVFVYFFIFVKYLFLSNSYLDMQFITSSLLVVLLSWMNTCPDKLTNEMKDLGKFLGHAMFISVCISLVCGFISFIYNILFYFGFINTIIVLNISCMFLMSNLVSVFKQDLNEKLSKSNIGNKILDLITYYYNTYIVSKKLGQKILEYIKIFIKDYLWVYIKIIYNKFIKINKELSNNSQSKIVKTKLDDKYSNAKNYITEQVAQPFFIKSFQSALGNDPFAMANLNKEIVTNKKNPYKNSLLNQGMNMNIISNTEVNDKDDLDDLDEELDLTNVLEVSKSQIDDAEKLEKELSQKELSQKKELSRKQSAPKSVTSEPKLLTPEERRAALRRKVAEKKGSRTGVKNQQTTQNQIAMQNQMANLMNMPGMNEMMENMFKGDNLEKIMKQMPKDKTNGQIPNIDQEQVKKMMRSMNTKK